MKRRTFLSGSILAGPLTAAAPGGEIQTKSGFAEAEITPKIGMEIPGDYRKLFHRAFHDPCKVRAAVFGDGEHRVAIASVDALIVARPVVLAARRRISERCGIAANAILIGATHSHSSGPVGMVQPGEYDHSTDLVKSLAYEKSSMADAAYLERLEAQIVDAVCRADSARISSGFSFGVGREDKAAFNRRFAMKNGLEYTHPGKGNPDIAKVAGPTDPDVGVIGCWDGKGNLLGCVVNFCCHATTSPDGISANWIYYMEKTIRGMFGPETVVVFLQGFSGDITQVDNLSGNANPGGEQWAKLVGGRVGAEAVKVLLSSPVGSAVPVSALTDVLLIPRRRPSARRVADCTRIARQDPKRVGMVDWLFAKEIVLLQALIEKQPEVEVEVQALQVGPAVLLSAPGEMFCQLGLDLKAARTFPVTFPVELANGSVGYVPTEEALGPHGGGYETRLTSYSNLVPQAGSRIVATALALARRLKPGTLPEHPHAPPFTTTPGDFGSRPWSYGNVPPEVS
jgi:hypothetical protein